MDAFSRRREDIICLAANESNVPTPEPVVEAAVEALRNGHTRYVDEQGDPELRDLIATRTTRRTGEPWSAEQVLITHGGTGALSTAILGMVNPGDRVVIPEPANALYARLVHLAGGIPVRVASKPGFQWDFDAMEVALHDAKLIVFGNPCNPTAVVHGEADLRALGDLLEGTRTWVLADEAYAGIVFDRRPFPCVLDVPSLRSRAVCCGTLSKTYAMTGWRLGHLVGPRAVVEAAALVQRSTTGPINSAVQRAGLAALRLGPDILTPVRSAYRARRDLTVRLLYGAPGLRLHPIEGTFYAFVGYEGPLPSAELVSGLRQAGVLVRPGAEYGTSGERHFRLSFATSLDELEEGLQRITGAMAPLLS